MEKIVYMAKISNSEEAEKWVRQNLEVLNLKAFCEKAGVSYWSFNSYLKNHLDPVGRPAGYYTPDTADKIIKLINKIIDV